MFDKPCRSISDISLSLRMNCVLDVNSYHSGIPFKLILLSFNGIHVFIIKINEEFIILFEENSKFTSPRSS